MDILEGNKLIAEFMGGHYQVHPMNHLGNENEYVFHKSPCEYFSATQFAEDRMHYHHYWDWLMPVVEKIESLGYKWEIGMSSTTPYHYCKIWSIGTVEGISPLDATYGACVEFIKWYNSWTEK